MQAENNKSFHTISAKHVRLSIYTNGPRCLICLPGLGLNGESFIKALPGDFSWILIDYMDYEKTEINDNFNLKAIANEIIELIISLELSGELYILSHSMGSILAGMCAEKINAKCWINLEGNLDPDDCFFSRRIIQYNHYNFVEGVSAKFIEVIKRSVDINKNSSLNRYLDHLKNINMSALWQHARDTVHDTDNRFARNSFMAFKGPKIYIIGESTRPTETLKALTERGGIKKLIIPGAGHFMINDNPGEVKRCIRHFVESC